MCNCLRYPACRAHSTHYIVICGLSGCTVFFRISYTVQYSGEKVIEHKMRVLIFSTILVWNISRSKKSWGRYCHKCIYEVCLKSRLNVWLLENWQHCSHACDSNRYVHCCLMFSASLNSITLTRLTWQRIVLVCVVVTRYENGETKSRAALRDQVLRRT